VDRGKVSAAHSPYLPPSVAQPSNELLLGRLSVYWQSLDVTDPIQIAALSQQALRRAAEPLERPETDPVARALLAASGLLDDWLAQALDLPHNPRALGAARAALLSGATPDWPKALLASPAETAELLAHLRQAIAEPTPAPLASAMPTQRIRSLTVMGLLRLLWRKLFGA